MLLPALFLRQLLLVLLLVLLISLVLLMLLILLLLLLLLLPLLLLLLLAEVGMVEGSGSGAEAFPERPVKALFSALYCIFSLSFLVIRFMSCPVDKQ